MFDATYKINNTKLRTYKGDIMRALINTIIVTIATTTTAFAAGSDMSDGPGILGWVFAGCCAMFVVCQAIPAVMLGTGAVKAIVLQPGEAKHRA
jgi:FtsH-binding integral membrane protein